MEKIEYGSAALCERCRDITGRPHEYKGETLCMRCWAQAKLLDRDTRTLEMMTLRINHRIRSGYTLLPEDVNRIALEVIDERKNENK